MKNSLQNQTAVKVKSSYLGKSADWLLTPLSAPEMLTDVSVAGTKRNADRGVVGAVFGNKLNQQDRILIDILSKNDPKKSIKTALKFLLLEKNLPVWRENMAIPPTSLLEKVCELFSKTDIPYELPIFTALSFLSGKLLSDDIKINMDGRIIRTDNWFILLAASGGGKTYAADVFQEAIKLDNIMAKGIVSAAAFVDELEKKNNGIWIKEEIAQVLKAMKTQSYMEELRGYLLELYNNGTIERVGRKKTITIENAALAIYGLNAYESFLANIIVEDLLDGLLPRFGIVLAEEDPNRPFLSVALYNWKQLVDGISKAWSKIKFPKTGAIYDFGRNAEIAYENEFYKRVKLDKNEIPPSFLKRTIFRAVKYSLIYHILLGKVNKKNIDGEDVAWGMRLADIHNQDIKKILREFGYGRLEKIVLKVEELKKKYELDGKILKPRDIISNIRDIKSVSEAKAILEISV